MRLKRWALAVFVVLVVAFAAIAIAVHFLDPRSLAVRLPHIDLKRCVGCGICENKCPVRGLPAIRTIAAGESRSPGNRTLL